jgi:UDP-N-acetylglucosamine 4,6-dehydratase/5-epimerase
MKSILVTGATGTIGSAVVNQALEDDWERIVIYSRDEYKQSLMEQGLRLHPHFHKLRFYLGDVRDLLRLEMALTGITHIIHAAALKRVEKCELDPIEAIKTNIDGTANVIHAALRKGVSHVCAISTDKVVRPVSLYGATKLTMERLVLAANNLSGGKCIFSVVRQGNIFGSRGSVVETWARLLANGCKSLPVSDPSATRYFVRSSDAATFTLDNLLTGSSGLKIPNNLKAFKVGDLAKAMNAPAIHITGLGAYEKLHEYLDEYQSSEDAPLMSVDDLRLDLKTW